MSAWIDITRPIDDTMMLWPNRPAPTRTWEKRLANGDHCNVSSWHINSHSGTHMDAPLHFIAGGTAINEIGPDLYMGDCVVIDIEAAGEVSEEVARHHAGVKRLLVRSGHSRHMSGEPYPPHAALMGERAAALLVEHGLKLIGTDRLSIDDSEGQGYGLHRLMLGAGCVILEGLSLGNVDPGAYFLAAAPLRLTGTEASPCRALLRMDQRGKVTQ